MPNVNITWAQDQLLSSRLGGDTAEAVLSLLEAWENLDIGDAKTANIIEAFSNLAQGHSLVPDAPDETWVEARMGFVHAGDIARIKHDAFSGATGQIHNGRKGKVVAARSGDVIFRSTDGKEPFLDGVHYPATRVEVRIR